MNLYPRSFLGLILLGIVLAMLPLLAALGYASLTVDDLTRRSEDAVKQSSQAATFGYALDEELGDMERILRQYDAMRDPMLLADYAQVRLEWRQSVEGYAAIPLLADMVARIGAMRDMEASAYRDLGSRGQGLEQLKATLASIRIELQFLLENASRVMGTEREVFRAQAEALWRRMVAALVAALVLTVLTLWLGRRMLARLLVRFERAVVALGEGRLKKKIRLEGPEDLQRVGLRLDWLRRRLLALETERTRVLRHVSHELKTPLAAIREGVSLLTDGIAGPLTPKQEKVAGIMQVNALRLQGLIDALLSMQQANHARDQMEANAVRFDKVVTQTLATYRLAMPGRRLHFSGSLEPLVVDGSGEALATVTSNLISNAVKFSPEGGLVSITLARQGQQAVLDVMDEGPGIPADDRVRIFEPFFRGAAAKGVAGAGLGLAIAHEFVLAHRGSLEFVTADQGGHFRLQLPLSGTAA